MMGGRQARRLWGRVRYFWYDLAPDGIELLSAMLSLSFAIVMLWQGNRSHTLDRVQNYAALCLVASACKFVGVLCEGAWLRVTGLLLAVVFWTTLSYALIHTNGSIAWLCFVVLMLAQLWAIKQVVRGGGRAG